jgi:hypothetical protein
VIDIPAAFLTTGRRMKKQNQRFDVIEKVIPNSFIQLILDRILNLNQVSQS